MSRKLRPMRRAEYQIAPGVLLVRDGDGKSYVELYDDAQDRAPLDRVACAAFLATTVTAADKGELATRAARIEVGSLVDLGLGIASMMEGKG